MAFIPNLAILTDSNISQDPNIDHPEFNSQPDIEKTKGVTFTIVPDSVNIEVLPVCEMDYQQNIETYESKIEDSTSQRIDKYKLIAVVDTQKVFSETDVS